MPDNKERRVGFMTALYLGDSSSARPFSITLNSTNRGALCRLQSAFFARREMSQ